jgi:midasin
MNQQSDSADLLGGFKPVELRLVCEPLKQTFEKLFCKTFSKSKNRSFLERVQQAFASKDWRGLINLFKKAVQLAEQKISEVENANLPSDAGNASTSMITPTKRQKTSETTAKTTYESSTARPVAQTGSTKSKAAWVEFKVSVERFELQHEQLKNNFAFSFIEGALVKAVRKGHWVLLDEINLASQETLESLSGLLEGSSLTLSERGDIAPIKRHPSFRLIGCMNPANDVGKKDLPPALRNRFSEFVLRELTNKEDLQLFVVAYLQSVVQNPPAQEIVEFYLAARHEAETSLSDGANQRPHYSLRTLARALDFTRTHAGMFGFDRSLVEGFLMSFLTQLDARSYPIMKALIKKFLQRGLNEKILERAPRNPGPNFVQFEQFWLELGPLTAFEDPKYILTPTIRQHLINLSRTLTSRKIPILLQGPTSAGKTSMLEYLAKRTGHRFVRINNHEHTDLQEYLGQYISDSRGKLYFQEGILVEAVRKGYWIVLDELNLAPSEVLEALNRLLDDNRELFIPETQETVKPHPHFMLFATQNPPGLYGGRKALSRAFRNRFIELHFDEIPDDELETILRERCFLPQSYCHQLVLIMKELQRNRQGSQVFAGRHGFITLRDLFRWAERHPTDYQQLADHGYMLLADRLRDPQEQVLVKQVLEKFLRVTIDVESLYEREFLHMMQTQSLETSTSKFGHAHSAHNLVANNVVWTRAMKRLYALVANCLRYKEPILLVGETGTGKTTVCQVLAELLGQELHILNCHQHTETADFIGGLRPVRGKEATVAELKVLLTEFFALARAHTDALFGTGVTIPAVDLDNVPDALRLFDSMSSQLIQNTNIAIVGLVEYPLIMTLISSINKKIGHYRALFSWYDGPLVKSMREGDILLVDEISLAEDAVLERLNSVLEPSRVLTIAEKGGAEVEELTAHADFRILATMNPGGDFGKKELSPALRNRFTEVWVPAIENRDDLVRAFFFFFFVIFQFQIFYLR